MGKLGERFYYKMKEIRSCNIYLAGGIHQTAARLAPVHPYFVFFYNRKMEKCSQNQATLLRGKVISNKLLLW